MRQRKLRITPPGIWYLALSIGMGVAAIISGNNALYLIECLLLSGLLLSGVLSERTISALQIQLIPRSCFAGQPSGDRIILKNPRRFPVFCVEVGEWKDGRFEPIAFTLRVGGRETRTLHSNQIFSSRGVYRVKTLAVATRYPFGFAKKIRLIPAETNRIVWPEVNEPLNQRGADRGSSRQSRRLGLETSDGEIRQFNHGDDYRSIVWTLSARGSDPLVRSRTAPEEGIQLSLDLRTEPGQTFEDLIRDLARQFHPPKRNGSLTVISSRGRSRIHGRKPILDQLALARPEGRKSA